MPGAPLLDFTRFHARQVVAGQHRFEQVLGLYLVVFQGSVRAGRRPHLARSGLVDAFEVGNVCSSCLVVQPFSGPTPGRLLRRLLTSAPSRRALPRVALCSRG